MNKLAIVETLHLTGLELAPSQVWGGVRLVPVLKRQASNDLRMRVRDYDEDLTVVSLEGEPHSSGLAYFSYVPHGLVLDWTSDGSPVAARDTVVGKRDGKRLKRYAGVRLMSKMVRREEKQRLRLLPLHTAMEGFLSLYFGGPEVAWSEYSKHAIRRGLGPRYETAYGGRWVHGLEEALRVFEIHDDQVGTLVFVSDALASAFVVSNPDDYRGLHRSLIADFYGELLFYYGQYAAAATMETKIEDRGIEDFAGLRRALEGMRDEWAAFQSEMSAGLVGRVTSAERIYRAGPFQLERFMTGFRPGVENHIGEVLRRDDGTVEYLKTYRLSDAQLKRAYLLSILAKFNWNMKAAAASERQSLDDFVIRLDKAGFGYLVNPDLLRQAYTRVHQRQLNRERSSS